MESHTTERGSLVCEEFEVERMFWDGAEWNWEEVDTWPEADGATLDPKVAAFHDNMERSFAVFLNPWHSGLAIKLGSVVLWPWAGCWSIIDRSGGSRLSLKQCVCHRFTLHVGPCAIEVEYKETD
jgi:hypothetical protein